MEYDRPAPGRGGGEVKIRARGSKFRNVPTRVNGFAFDSKMEARRYQELLLLEKAGRLHSIEVHRRFPLDFHGVHICDYEADFCYWMKIPNGVSYIVEDVKGHRTDVYKLKKKLMKALLGLDIIETRPR